MASRSIFAADDRNEALRLADIGLRRARDSYIAGGHAPPGEALSDMIAAFDTHVGTPDDVITSLRADSTLQRGNRSGVSGALDRSAASIHSAIDRTDRRSSGTCTGLGQRDDTGPGHKIAKTTPCTVELRYLDTCIRTRNQGGGKHPSGVNRDLQCLGADLLHQPFLQVDEFGRGLDLVGSRMG